jgi:hypothetical protein
MLRIRVLLLPEGQTGEPWEHTQSSVFLSETGEHWIEKYFQLAFRGLWNNTF